MRISSPFASSPNPLGWWRIPLTACVFAVLMLAIPVVSYAQEDEADGAPQDEESTLVDESLVITVDEAAPFSAMEAVDGVFAEAVNLMLKVLFYRVMADEQTYIETNHVEYYYRTRGSDDRFQAFKTDQRYDSLSLAQADALMARGKLELGIVDPESDEPRPFRLGLLGTDGQPANDQEKIEYVTLVIDKGNQYVPDKEGGKTIYRRLEAPRSVPTDDKSKWLSAGKVNELAEKGWLVVDTEKSTDPWLLTREAPNTGAPVVVLWLAMGSVLFTLYMRFVNVWGFRHAIDIVRGVYDNPDEPGEVTHFQALASALSATVGLGNIAGVTIAMTMGGPGAFFWMLLCGAFGMTSKFVECTLGQMYRTVKEDGTILGGPMQYLHKGLQELGIGPFGLVLSILFAVMCILASFGGGNMFQANQSGAAALSIIQEGNRKQLSAINDKIRDAAEVVASDEATQEDIDKLVQLQTQRTQINNDLDATKTYFLPVFGVILAVMVGLVIIGGIKRIGAAASKIVPTMCLIYIAACLVIIFMHITEVPALIGTIFTEAFSPAAITGGVVGVLVIGVQRAAFSNEAGVGSAAIAHSAAKTEEPVREGAVALLGPFIDTVVVCSMTALVILITGAWNNEAWTVEQGLQGAALTAQAFGEKIAFFPYVLTVAIILFAFSTIISWSYYGERCWERLFGAKSIIVYRAIYVIAVFVGTIVNLGAVLDFSDMMILSMAFPNVLGCLLLAPKVRAALLSYWQRYKEGKFKTFK